MPRRRLNVGVAEALVQLFTGLSPMASQGALTLAKHAREQRSGQIDATAKSHLVKYEHIKGRRKPRRRYNRGRKGIPVDLSLRGGKLAVKTFKNKISDKSKAMPYRPKRPIYGRRKGKYGRPRRRRLSVPLGFPRKKLVRFRMVGYNTLTSTTGTIAVQAFKANSLNDPAGAAGAQLPLSVDQWSAFYEKYIVLGSKITVRFGSTTNTGPMNVGIHLHKNDTALTSVVHYRELPMTRIKTLTTQKDGGILTMKYSGKKFWHLASITSDSEQEAAFSTTPGDPTDLAYFHVFCQDMAGAHTAVVDYQFEIEFICMLNEPVNLARSSL